MKVFINNFNLLTWPKAMAERLVKIPDMEIIFLDNASDYPPLLEWYSSCAYKVIHLGGNYGHRAGWITGVIQRELGNDSWYCYTDPDLGLDDLPDDFMDKLMEGAMNHPSYAKCGLGLVEKEEVFPVSNTYTQSSMAGLRSNGPRQKFEDGVVNSPVDTTFAVYPARTTFHTCDGVQLDYPYRCYHIPYHLCLDPEPGKICVPFDDECYYYFTRANSSSTGKHHLSPMIEEYARRKGL